DVGVLQEPDTKKRAGLTRPLCNRIELWLELATFYPRSFSSRVRLTEPRHRRPGGHSLALSGDPGNEGAANRGDDRHLAATLVHGPDDGALLHDLPFVERLSEQVAPHGSDHQTVRIAHRLLVNGGA